MLKFPNGIDLSHHNKGIEADIRESDFVILRAGYGKNHIDHKFYKYYDLCKKYNKPFGIYWFSYATTIDGARNEAQYVIDIIKGLDVKPTLPIFIDWEADSEKNLAKAGKKFTWGFYNAVCNTFCKHLEKNGCYAGIYCDYNHYKRLYNNSYCIWLAKWDNKKTFIGLKKDIWLKQYTVNRSKNLDLNILRSKKLIEVIENRGFNNI